MFLSKRNKTLYLFLLLSILGTYLGDFVTAAPIISGDGNSATLTCKERWNIQARNLLTTCM